MSDQPQKPEIALETRANEADRLFSPSAARNREPIRETFLRYLPATGVILEVGAGTGEHAAALARALPGLSWHAGDPDAASRRSIAAWTAHEGLANMAAPHALDVSAPDWWHAAAPFDAIVSINMIHIAPFAAAQGLVAGAARHLKPGGALILYGPFSRDGAHTAPSNAAFDTSLKARNPSWGVRDLEQDIAPLCDKHALAIDAVVEMPANNFTVVIRKR